MHVQPSPQTAPHHHQPTSHPPSPPTSIAINAKDFFFSLFFILRAHGWVVSAWHGDASIRAPPNRVNTVCDLLAKSLTTPSHRRPSSPSPLSPSNVPPSLRFLSPIRLRQHDISLSLCLLIFYPPSISISLSLSFYDTHMRTESHTYCTFSPDRITHSSLITHLIQVITGSGVICVCAVMSVLAVCRREFIVSACLCRKFFKMFQWIALQRWGDATGTYRHIYHCRQTVLCCGIMLRADDKALCYKICFNYSACVVYRNHMLRALNKLVC